MRLKSSLVYLILIQLSWAQYVVTSPYLIEPDKSIGYVDSCAAFWLKTWDESNGGFYTNIDKYGNVISSWGTNKNMLTQTRNAYGLIRAFMLTGNQIYLEYAKSALTFLYDHAWDYTYGGWYSDLDEDGNPTSRYAGKTAFNQHYALLGIMAACEATDDTIHWSWLQSGYQHLEDHFWDSRIGYEGYYDETAYNGSSPKNKSFNATVDAVTTHLLYLYLLTREDIYLFRLEEIADEMIHRLVSSMDYQAIGFAEKYNSNWQVNSSETMTIMGHVLKTAWCLGRIYQINADENYLPAAEKLILDVWEKGYDHHYGGPYKDYNRSSGEMLMWGNPDTVKAWWQMEQAVVAGLQLFNITGDSLYLRMADETLSFFMQYFVDHEYGEVYENRTRSGSETWGENKGGGGKAGYHSIELGYYTYLYGKLMFQKEAASLYYYFKPLDFARDIRLYPLAINKADFQIGRVELNDSLYSKFSNTDHLLHLDAGVGGKFKVTFIPDEHITTIITDIGKIAENFILYPNFPNPFNSATKLQFDLKKATHVIVRIYDIKGIFVRLLYDGIKNPGYKLIEWDGKNQQGQSVGSGIYIYQITTPQQTNSGRCLFIK